MPEVAIVGAGPFGLSVAAHLGAAARVHGPRMETWKTRMPPEMLLRSAWKETSLSAPGGGGSIDVWAEAEGEPRREPIPLPVFLRYSDWFGSRFVRENDPASVTLVERMRHGFRVTNDLGESNDVRAVVLATGFTPFSKLPRPFARSLGTHASFAIDEQSYDRFAGKRVLVAGAGQAGLESAALAARAGADVEVVARSGVRWFADHEPHHARGALGRRVYRMAYPVVGYGPPPLNRLTLHPDLFAAMPSRVRQILAARILRSGGSPWVRSQVEGTVRITIASPTGYEDGRVSLSDGSTRDVDHVLLATGYRFDLERLTFLSPDLRAAIRTDGAWPHLDRYFQSTVPGLFFIGYPAEGRFGPLARFVLGCGFTARRVASAFGISS